MAQGDFTKEEASKTLKAVDELFEAIPKNKRMGFIGHLNDVCLFIEAAKKAAPKSEDNENGESPTTTEN